MARVISNDKPRKPIRRRVVLCETCWDERLIDRIHGGRPFTEACPDCAGGAW